MRSRERESSSAFRTRRALRDLRVTPAEPGHLADAALALADRPEVDGSGIGLAGFSAGASMALDAAADPRLAGHLGWVSSFGGYADAERLLVDVASRTTLNPDGTVSPWQPDPGIRHDVLGLAMQALPDDGQRERSCAHARASRRGAIRRAPWPSTSRSRFRVTLNTCSSCSRRRDRPTALAAAQALSPELRAQLAAISPITYADRIHVPVYLLHGVTDTAIPVAHAALLRAALGDQSSA